MQKRFMSGMLAGSIIGATAGMYAFTRMSPKQRKRMMKVSRSMLNNVMSNMNVF